MSLRRARRSLFPILRVIPVVLVLLLARASFAATPGSGTISLATPTLSWSGSVTGAGSGENTCVNGVSCDSFQVTLAPGDYTGKQITLSISWTVPAYDYDLYVHVGTLDGPSLPPSAGGPPSTSETVHIGIDPPVVVTPRVWWAHIQAATVPPLQTYQGHAVLADLPASPNVTHLDGHATFSHSVPLYARGTVRTEEPSVRVDVRGNCYVGGIRGVPAGVDMWRFDLDPQSPTFDPEMRNGAYLGQPDAFQQMGAEDSTAGGADGGGDIEIATNFPTNPDSTPVVTMVSLAVADISSSLSGDRGTSWQHNPAAAAIPSDDRQWIEADGPNTVYLFYRAPVPSAALFVQKSTDHGFTYGAPIPVLDSNNPISTTPGYISVDHANGYVYVSHENSNALYVSRSTDGGTTWTTTLVDGLTGHGHLFDPVKVGQDGTVYTAWSDDRHIYYSYSADHGSTWTVPAIVENPDSTVTNVFPWLSPGSAGRVDFVWYGTKSANSSAAEWDVYFAQSLDANTPNPTFRQERISDHRIHGSNISEGGLTGSANRNLGDYFQIAYDPQGAAVVSFADDHNDFDGNTYVVRQLDGPGVLASANGGSGMVSPEPSTDMPQFSWSEPEVTDPVHDATIETQPVPTDNPFDIVSIQYFADQNGPNAPYLGARMKLSGLTGAVEGAWRMAFTSNAPWAVDQLPDGVSDHGNMFYLMATDTTGVPSFTFGTAYRDSTPLTPASTAYAMAYNAVGAADSGSVDTTTSTVTIKVALSKINALIPPTEAPIGEGSWLSGLRGSAGAIGAGPHDNTRGGRYNFFVNFGGVTGVGPGGPPAILSLAASPNPSRQTTMLFYSMPVTGQARLAIYDVRGRLVNVLRSGRLEEGPNRALWDGRMASGAASPEGVYFAALETASGKRTVSRFVRIR